MPAFLFAKMCGFSDLKKKFLSIYKAYIKFMKATILKEKYLE